MDIEIQQEGKGQVEIFSSVPAELEKMLLPMASPVAIGTNSFQALFQQFGAEGFSVWLNRYFTKTPVILKARADIPVFELRIALMNQIEGTWESITQPSLKKHYFSLGFTPHVLTRAIFNKPGEYQTIDIHFELSFLFSLGFEYSSLHRFLESVSRNQPSELSPQPYRCPAVMIDAVQLILHNNYSLEGKKQLLQCKVKEILLLALETAAINEQVLPMVLKPDDISKLQMVRELIAGKIPEYPGNDILCQQAGLNEFKLSVGFRHFFGMSPYDYHMMLKFNYAKELLREPENNIEGVAFMLGYDQSSSFIKEFKKLFKYTPGWWRKGS